MLNQAYDTIIIGAGPAGMSAGIYLARKKIKTLILSKDVGGLVNYAPVISNYIGLDGMCGVDMTKKFEEHLKNFEIEQKIGVEVKKISGQAGNFEVETQSDKFFSKTILIASGRVPKKMGISGEAEFSGKGVFYCAVCDAPLMKNKEVAVIGGGNSALASILSLEPYATKIYSINLNAQYGLLGGQADEHMVDKVNNSSKVEILHEHKALEILGDKFVKSLKIMDLKSNQEKNILIGGIFIGIGYNPSIDFIKGLVILSEAGEIIINKKNATTCPGIFAAGDVTDVIEKQIIIAAGEGAKAALAVSNYLLEQK
jgi:NADH-dependent peroxiredoxin subunit F